MEKYCRIEFSKMKKYKLNEFSLKMIFVWQNHSTETFIFGNVKVKLSHCVCLLVCMF